MPLEIDCAVTSDEREVAAEDAVERRGEHAPVVHGAEERLAQLVRSALRHAADERRVRRRQLELARLRAAIERKWQDAVRDR